jgi:hypothetical protein
VSAEFLDSTTSTPAVKLTREPSALLRRLSRLCDAVGDSFYAQNSRTLLPTATILRLAPHETYPVTGRSVV